MLKQSLYKLLKKIIIIGIRCFFRKTTPSKQSKIKKLLVISLDALGDTLFITPLLHSLREHYPDTHISICVKSFCKEIVDTNPYIDEIITFDKHAVIQGRGESGPYKLYLKEKFNFLKEIRAKKFDLVIDCSGIISTNLFAFFSGAQRVIGLADKGVRFLLDSPVLDDRNLTSYPDRTLKIINSLGITPVNNKPEYFIPDFARCKVDHFLDVNKVSNKALLVGIHPSAGWKAKCWVPDKFGELIKLIMKTYHANVILFGSPDDYEIINRITSIVSSKSLIKANKLSLHETSALIERCKLVIGNDSIVLHLAETFGIPTIGIYGPTNPTFSSPQEFPHRCINKKLKCIPINTAYCKKNAGLDGKCKTIDCMRLLTVEEVWKVVKEQMDWIIRNK